MVVSNPLIADCKPTRKPSVPAPRISTLLMSFNSNSIILIEPPRPLATPPSKEETIIILFFSKEQLNQLNLIVLSFLRGGAHRAVGLYPIP